MREEAHSTVTATTLCESQACRCKHKLWQLLRAHSNKSAERKTQVMWELESPRIGITSRADDMGDSYTSMQDLSFRVLRFLPLAEMHNSSAMLSCCG